MKLTQLMYVALLVSIFAVGYFFSRVQYLEQQIKNGAPTVAGTQTATTQTNQAPEPKVTREQVQNAFMKSQIKFGNANAKLVVVEVADPSCPYCHVAGGKNPELNKQISSRFTLQSDGGTYIAPVPELKKLLDEGKIAFSYVYYPGHGNGEMGTKALYCANEKGKFWEVQDMLMSSAGYDLLNNSVKNDTSKAKELADFLAPVFDASAMKNCIESGKYDSKLKEDMELGTSLSIQGTPGFYLNDTIFNGAYNFTDMEDAIKKAGVTI